MRYILTVLTIALFIGCNSDADKGHSTPIDSTNLNGTAPATYSAENPANAQDTNYVNSTDTGTKVSNGDSVVHRKIKK